LSCLTLDDYNFYLGSTVSKYPELKRVYHVTDAAKTEAELVNVQQVKDNGDKLLNHYMDIAKNADKDLDGVIKTKAAELKMEGLKAEHMKVIVYLMCYG
jgi:hypothetical protein